MKLSCPDDLHVYEGHHAASAPDGNMEEDSVVQVAKYRDETETDEVNNTVPSLRN